MLIFVDTRSHILQRQRSISVSRLAVYLYFSVVSKLVWVIGPPAIDILRKGLDDLQFMMEGILRKFDEAVEGGQYEHHPDAEI